MSSKFFFAIIFTAICFLSCKTTKIDNTACKGEAIKDCITTMEYKPVCGCDGKTYGNTGSARCAGIKTWVEGECPK